MRNQITGIDKTDNCLLRIANVVSLYINDLPSYGLLDGKIGASIFFHLYAQYSGEELYKNLARELIEEVGSELDTVKSFDFVSGLTGIGWGLEYLSQNGYEGLEEYMEKVGGRINAEVLKEPVLMKKQGDLYGYGLYYLLKNKRILQDEDKIQKMVVREMLDSLYIDCERLLSKNMVIGKQVPKLKVHQLNSVLHFILHLQDIDSKKFKFILKYVPSYFRKLQDKGCNDIDFEVFRCLIRKLKARINDQDLLIKYEILDSEIKVVRSPGDAVDAFTQTGWYRILYAEDYTMRLDEIVNTKMALYIASDQQYWENFQLNLDRNKLGLEGVAGLGLILLAVKSPKKG